MTDDRVPEDEVERLLKGLEPAELPPFHTERLVARLRAGSRAASAGGAWKERLLSPRLAWAVAGVCVAALVLVMAGGRRLPEPPVPAVPGVSVVQAGIDPVTPADNSVIGAEDVEIVAAIYPPVERGVVRLYVDEVDVTGLAEVTGSYVMYSPAGEFEEGEHIVTIEIRDRSGAKLSDVSWLFYTLDGRHPEPADRV